jgi:hypothetical protein
MDELREILSIGYLKTENPKMIWLGQDPWGYQCSVPEQWLKEWLNLPEGESDTREGKAWWYTSPEHQEPTSYHVENRQGVLYIEVEVSSEFIDPRRAALPVDELRHWFAAEPRMVNLSQYNCFVPEAWLADWLRLPEGEQDVRVGKTWGYLPPDDNQDATYRAKILDGYLVVEIETKFMPTRQAVVALADFDLSKGGMAPQG